MLELLRLHLRLRILDSDTMDPQEPKPDIDELERDAVHDELKPAVVRDNLYAFQDHADIWARILAVLEDDKAYRTVSHLAVQCKHLAAVVQPALKKIEKRVVLDLDDLQRTPESKWGDIEQVLSRLSRHQELTPPLVLKNHHMQRTERTPLWRILARQPSPKTHRHDQTQAHTAHHRRSRPFPPIRRLTVEVLPQSPHPAHHGRIHAPGAA